MREDWNYGEQEGPSKSAVALRIIGWVDFAAGCLLLLIALSAKGEKSSDITILEGIIFFIQGIIVCTLFNAIAAIVTYLFEIKETLKS